MMDKIKLLLGIIAVCVLDSLSAQNWKPVTKTDKYNYIKDSTYYTVWVDSSKLINGDSVFFLNKIMKKVKEGDKISPFYADGYYLENKSQFFLSEIINMTSGDVVMKENDSRKLLLKPLAKLNDTWVFDSLKRDTAKVIAITTTNVLGSTDSVKIVTLSTSKDTILLSKNFGILKFPYIDSVHQYVNLTGIEGKNAGVIIPKFKDIFDFKVGDVFYYKVTTYARLSEDYVDKKITIKKREDTPNSIKYTFSYTSKRYNIFQYSIKTTIYKSVPDSVIVFTDSMNSFFNKYTNQSVNDGTIPYEEKKPVQVFAQSQFDVIAKTFPERIFCKGNGDTIVQTPSPHLCADAYHNAIYGKSLGLINKFYNSYLSPGGGYAKNESLIGYIRDGKQIGTITDDSVFLGVPEYGKGSFYHIYPNPATDNFTIESLSNKGKVTVSIYTITGDELISQQFQGDKTNIDISTLAKGLYIVKLISYKSMDVVKILKE